MKKLGRRRLDEVVHKTAFHRWRDQMRLTQEQAAEVLGVSRSQVANWDSGRDRMRDKPIAPPLCVRKVMHAMVLGRDCEPWPE